MITTHVYDPVEYQSHSGFDVKAINKALKAGNHVWIDLCGLQDEKLIHQLCQDFEIHALVMEDLLNTHQRPKLEIVEDYLFIVLKILTCKSDRQLYHSEQFSLLIKDNLLITLRESSQFDFNPLYQRLRVEHSLIREQGSDYLTYLLIDTIIDSYFDFVEQTSKQLDGLENLLINNPEKLQLKELYMVKRRTISLRKTLAPLRDIIHLLISEHSKAIQNKFYLYYRDLHDHCIRLVEQIDLHREMIGGMQEIYLSIQNNRMNEIMKILTLFASIFIPLTFIAGIYGMNFDYMPELKWRWGYPTVLLFMAGVAGLMLYYFKRKRLI